MRARAVVSGLGVLGAIVAFAVPAAAQASGDTHEVHIYAGQVFGDDLTDENVSGRTPELDDDVGYGLRYGYNFTEAWGLEVSAGYNPNTATGVRGGETDVDLATLDVDAVWRFAPQARVGGYLLAGAGYGQASLDEPIRGTAGGNQVTIDEDSGFTLNAGIGARYSATESFLIRAEARYRYLDQLVDNLETSMNTVETTLGVGWTF